MCVLFAPSRRSRPFLILLLREDGRTLSTRRRCLFYWLRDRRTDNFPSLSSLLLLTINTWHDPNLKEKSFVICVFFFFFFCSLMQKGNQPSPRGRNKTGGYTKALLMPWPTTLRPWRHHNTSRDRPSDARLLFTLDVIVPLERIIKIWPSQIRHTHTDKVPTLALFVCLHTHTHPPSSKHAFAWCLHCVHQSASEMSRV